MTDTASRTSIAAPRLLADALLRSVAGTSAQLRLTGTSTDSSQSELGVVATSFLQAVISPVVMRRLRPTMREGDEPRWELLVSATAVEQQVSTLDLASAQALFSMTLALTIAGQDYLIESISSNEAFGETYLYRLALREARRQAV